MPKRARSEDSTSRELEGPSSSRTRGEAEAEADGLTRILSWNVETPVPFLQLPRSKARAAANATPSVVPGSNPRLLRDLMRRHEFPDFVCLQEVRARHTDKEWISALRLAANYGTHGSGLTGMGSSSKRSEAKQRESDTAYAADGPKYTMYHSLSRATRGQRHFGVATFVRDPSAVAAVREVDWDAEGRVLVLEMKTGWALVNVYALNGSEFMWRDPLGQASPTTRNERKREFNRLLLGECVAMQRRGLRLVLIGDFNISLTEMDCVPRLRTEYPHGLAREEFREQFITGANVVDIFREMHPDQKAYSWFAKGKPQGADCARVDYVLVDSTLREHVVDVTYLTDQDERAHSDHAPLLLTMKNMTGLASGASDGMQTQPQSHMPEPHEST